MKSKILEDRYIIECDCGFPDHLLLFDIYYDPTDGYTDISVYICSTYGKSIWNRIKLAFNYILGKEDYLYTDAVMISHKNIEDLEEVIKRIKEIKESKK